MTFAFLSVSMIQKIAVGITTFLFILLIMLIGFTCGYWELSYTNQDAKFRVMDFGLLNMFNGMLFGVYFDFSDTVSPPLGTVLIIIFTIFMT